MEVVARSTALQSVLDGRQSWYEVKLAVQKTGPGYTWVELSLNIPGWPKRAPWSDQLFTAGRRQITTFLESRLCASLRNEAGSFALFHTEYSPYAAKLRAITLEQRHTWGRLWDIDCYGPQGKITRGDVGAPERRCLGCDKPHDCCIGQGTHDLAFIRQQAKAIAARSPEFTNQEIGNQGWKS